MGCCRSLPRRRVGCTAASGSASSWAWLPSSRAASPCIATARGSFCPQQPALAMRSTPPRRARVRTQAISSFPRTSRWVRRWRRTSTTLFMRGTRLVRAVRFRREETSHEKTGAGSEKPAVRAKGRLLCKDTSCDCGSQEAHTQTCTHFHKGHILTYSHVAHVENCSGTSTRSYELHGAAPRHSFVLGALCLCVCTEEVRVCIEWYTSCRAARDSDDPLGTL